MKKLFILSAVFTLLFSLIALTAENANAALGIGDECGICVGGNVGNQSTNGDLCNASSDCNTAPYNNNCVSPTTTGVSGTPSDTCGSGLTCGPFLVCVSINSSNTNNLDLWGGHSGGQVTRDSLQGQTGLGDKDPRTIAANVVNVVLGFLGIIAVLLILVGGFRWMTAQGNDEAVANAKNLMIAGVVGLIIILAAFGIARFVIDALTSATV